jgi:hypothetical protein
MYHMVHPSAIIFNGRENRVVFVFLFCNACTE